MIDIEWLLAWLRRSDEQRHPWSVTPNEAAALVAEVERLRGQRHADNEAIAGAWDAGRDNERAAVVKWLRDEAARLRKAMFVGSRAYVLESTAYMIENGVHAEQQEKT